jgi:hypothetical protein
MIEPTQAISAAKTGGTPAARTAAVEGVKSFANVLAKSSNTASSAETTPAKAAARPDGEQTKKVDGHRYAKIINGDDKGLYLNQVAGNPRLGKAFRLVERDDHVFHIYGTGKDRVIVGVTPKATADATTTTTAPATGGTTSTGDVTSTGDTTPKTT